MESRRLGPRSRTVTYNIRPLPDGRRGSGDLRRIEASRIAGARHVAARPLALGRHRLRRVIDREQHARLAVEYLAVLQSRSLCILGVGAGVGTPQAGMLRGGRLGFVRLGLGKELRRFFSQDAAESGNRYGKTRQQGGASARCGGIWGAASSDESGLRTPGAPRSTASAATASAAAAIPDSSIRLPAHRGLPEPAAASGGCGAVSETALSRRRDGFAVPIPPVPSDSGGKRVPMAARMACATRSWNSKPSLSPPSKRSAQICRPAGASISWPLTRSRFPALRTLPSRT